MVSGQADGLAGGWGLELGFLPGLPQSWQRCMSPGCCPGRSLSPLDPAAAATLATPAAQGGQPWDKARAGQHQEQPVPVGCGLRHHAEVCGWVISKTLISPGSVTGSVCHKSGCLAWGLDLPQGSVGW